MSKMIVCFGDSNTHGYDASTNGRFDENTRWPCVLQQILGPDYVVREEGMSGRTAVFEDPLFEGLNGLDAIYPALMTHEPVDLLIIMLGTNDVKERFCATPENIAKGMGRLIAKAKASTEAWRGGIPHILLICPPPINPLYAETDVYGEMGDYVVEKSRKLAPLYEQTAKEQGVDFLDAAQLPGIEMTSIDGMHFGKDIHLKFAQELAQVVRKNEELYRD